ncbi:MAG: hypothetical protein AB4911_20845, partial [Oscillochloridaceae bacterium umkhey_bin13]
WVSQFGGQVLPVVALFGVVQSSGVVGVDEKWVRVHIPGKRGYPFARPYGLCYTLRWYHVDAHKYTHLAATARSSRQQPTGPYFV